MDNYTLGLRKMKADTYKEKLEQSMLLDPKIHPKNNHQFRTKTNSLYKTWSLAMIEAICQIWCLEDGK